jgi:hypothetical protein
MEKTPSSNGSVLAIAPVSHGCGYALFEGLDVMVDWSIKEVRRVDDKNARCLQLLGDLLDQHQPGTVVLADWRDPQSRRGARVRALLPQIAENAAQRGIPVAVYRKEDVASVFQGQGAKSKYETARAIARLYPELGPRLPRRRRIWQGEQYQMAIFDAVALAVTHLALADGQKTLPFPT